MKNILDLYRRWRLAPPGAKWVAIGIVLALVAVRLYLPSLLEAYVNRQLNRSRDYGGRIGTVDLRLWRGQYSIHAVTITKRDGDIQTPFFSARALDLSIEWMELFHGAIVGQVVMEQPRLNFVSGPTPEQTQTGKEESWNTILESLFPFDLNRVEIENGEIHFQNEHSDPRVDIYLNKITAVATNLSNARNLKSELPAGITAHATTIGGGGVDLQLQLDPLANAPTYQLTTQLTNVNVTALNDFLRAYGKFDVERGVFALYTSVAAKDGNYDGYVKVFFHDLHVFAWNKERQKDVLQVFWQAIVGTVATILKNQPKDSLAARIPISGSYHGTKIGIWAAVGTLLSNAFIHALVPKVDDIVTVTKVEQKVTVLEERRAEMGGADPTEKGAQTLTKPKGAEASIGPNR